MCRVQAVTDPTVTLQQLFDIVAIHHTIREKARFTAFEVLEDLMHRFGPDSKVKLQILPYEEGRNFDNGDVQRICGLEDKDVTKAN